jgi:hypothetical protein
MRTLSPAEMREFLAFPGKKSIGTHSMTKKICHWSYCSRCGLLALKNSATRRALRAPCVTYE